MGELERRLPTRARGNRSGEGERAGLDTAGETLRVEKAYLKTSGRTHQSTCDSWSARRSLIPATVLDTVDFTAVPTKPVTVPRVAIFTSGNQAAGCDERRK